MQSHYLKIWDKYITERNRALSPMKFTNDTEKFIWVLFVRINSLSDEIIFLVRNSQFSSSQILIRSVLETYIDLKCLVDDDLFIENLLQAEIESEMKYLKHHDPCNPFYGTQSKEDIETKLKALNNKNDKTKKLSIFDKFEKANELDVFRTVYNHLCRFSHGNMTALASKNFEDEQIQFHRSISDHELIVLLSYTIGLAIASAIEVSSKLELGDKTLDIFKELSEKNKTITAKFA